MPEDAAVMLLLLLLLGVRAAAAHQRCGTGKRTGRPAACRARRKMVTSMSLPVCFLLGSSDVSLSSVS